MAENKRITRKEATEVLCELAHCGVLAEEYENALEEIRSCIQAEEQGLHLWGADSEETSRLFVAYRSDLVTDELKSQLDAIQNKHSFIPAPYEKDLYTENDEYGEDFD